LTFHLAAFTASVPEGTTAYTELAAIFDARLCQRAGSWIA
jgi:hypothetical protein